jgi:hypothetical protein
MGSGLDSALDLAVEAIERICGDDLRPLFRGEGRVGVHNVTPVVHHRGFSGKSDREIGIEVVRSLYERRPAGSARCSGH